MRKFVLTLVIGLFFVTFSNAQNTNTEKSDSETAVKSEKKIDLLKKSDNDKKNTENVLDKTSNTEGKLEKKLEEKETEEKEKGKVDDVTKEASKATEKKVDQLKKKKNLLLTNNN